MKDSETYDVEDEIEKQCSQQRPKRVACCCGAVYQGMANQSAYDNYEAVERKNAPIWQGIFSEIPMSYFFNLSSHLYYIRKKDGFII